MQEDKTFHYIRNKPAVQVTMKHLDREVALDAVVDSGSDISIFDSTAGEQIGIKASRFEQKEIVGVSGSIKANVVKVRARVLDEFFELPVAFVQNYSGPFNIIGRKGFFEKHIITFDEAKLEIVVKKNAP